MNDLIFIIKSRVSFYLLILVLFNISLLFVNDIKSMILVTCTLALSLLLVKKTTLTQTLFLTCINVIWLEKGIRGINLLVLARGAEPWMSSYSIYFGLSIKLILILCLAIMLLFKTKSASSLRNVLLIILMSLGGLSVLISSDYLLAYSGFIRLFSAIALFFISSELLKNATFKQLVIATLVSVFAFQAAVGVYQLFNANQLPIYLNDAYGLRESGYFTSDGPSIFRVTGLVGHPTYFGSLMVLLLPFVLWKLIERYAIFKNKLTAYSALVFIVVVLVFILGSIAIYGSFSRSAWIISAFTFLVFLWSETKKKSLKFKKIIIFLFVALMLLVFAFVPNMRERIATIPDFISAGSGKVRVQLMQESLVIISQHPFFGVGPNHFVRAMAQRDLVPELRGFMFPVHNTFLLLASEMGMPMVTVLIIIISLSLMKLRTSCNPKKNLERIAIFTAIVSFIISSQFHALYNQDPTFELLFVLLAWSKSV